MEEKRYSQVLSIISQMRKLQKTTEVGLRVNYARLYVFEILAFRRLGRMDLGVKAARETLSVLDEMPLPLSQAGFSAKELEGIRDLANEEIQSHQGGEHMVQMSLIPKLGRNASVQVKYEDGFVKREKFKRVEDDLQRGRCVLLE